MDTRRIQLGLVGLGVMGQNLALNLEEHGVGLQLWNLEPGVAPGFTAKFPGRDFTAHDELSALVQALHPPRVVLLMVRAGSAVDEVLAAMLSGLEAGDIVVDGGNSHFADTERRREALHERGIRWLGMGVSGGEEGARRGPALMPGGSREAYEHCLPWLRGIAARSRFGPCVGYMGSAGAGHFVKMVHNGIEYGEMQLLAEGYQLLRDGAGLEQSAIAERFSALQRGPLESFLLDVTCAVLRRRDKCTGGFLLPLVVDEAAQKGTGLWTVQAALDLGVSVPTLAAAVEARMVSAATDRRAALRCSPWAGTTPALRQCVELADLEAALLLARWCVFVQGLNLLERASTHHQWGTDLREVVRCWTAGCIIRSSMLEELRNALEPGTSESLLAHGAGAEVVTKGLPALRRIVGQAVQAGVPAPAFSATLAHLDSLVCPALPQSLIQAQRDAFGAHTYKRSDDPTRTPQHTDWFADDN